MSKDRIAYLGPKATFTNEAALKYFGTNNIFIPVKRIKEMFYKLKNKDVDYCVVPSENSTGGSIGDTLDLFVKTDLKIYDQTTLKIKQNLLSLYKKEEITKIFAHPQSFRQCSDYITNNFSNAEIIETYSNAEAAEFAKKTKYSASIGSVLCINEYHLNLVEEEINDNKNNETRFFIISNDKQHVFKDKSLIIFAVKNKPGKLYDALKVFKDCEINMTKIESRPSQVRNWDYVFIVEYENSMKIKNNVKLIKKLKKKCSYLDYLGSY